MPAPLRIAASRDTPALCADDQTGEITISGQSYPLNAASVYEPLLTWIDQYWVEGKHLTINFHLSYFNTSTSKYLFNLIKKTEMGYEQGKSVVINWIYDPDDDDMRESGEEFKDTSVVPFNLIAR